MIKEMIINALKCFLIICIAKGSGYCPESHKSHNKTFSIYRPFTGTIGQTTRLNISKGNCSERNEAHEILIKRDAINAELIKLSLCHDFFNANWDTFLNVGIKHPWQNLIILLTYDNDEGLHEVCLEISSNTSIPKTEETFTLVFNHIQTVQMHIKGIEENQIYQQNLSIWRKELINREGNEWRRFVYVDTTTIKDKHKIHIARVTDDAPKIYNLLRNNTNNEMHNIWDTYDTEEIILTTPFSNETWYIIQEKPRTYLQEIITSVIGIILFILIVSISALWYASKPKQQKVVVIYCQCDRHSVYGTAVRKLLHLLEQNCMLTFEPPSPIFSRINAGEDENLLNGRSKAVGFIVFIPFPNVADHDRSYENEAHQFCEKYSRSGRKIELNFHFEHCDFSIIRSEWPKGSYKSFQLLEELPNFIRYVHPFYLPSFLERYLRPLLWAPRIKRLLERNTFTNDHLREITDPKFHAQIKTVSNSLQADPTLALNAFI